MGGSQARCKLFVYGRRLANAREKLEAKKLVLSELAQKFIEAGMRAHTDELVAAAKRIRRFRILIFGLLLALIAAVFLGFVAQWQANIAIANGELALIKQEEAQQQATIARAGELAAYAVSQHDKQFDLSLLLSVEAFHTADMVRTQGVLLDNTLTNPGLVQYLRGHSYYANSIAFSPDGKTVASGSEDQSIILWDVASGQLIGQPLQGHRRCRI